MIYGVQKLSLVDYPQEPSFVIFLGGCNFRCPFCHNRGIVEKEYPVIPLEDVYTMLEERKHFVHHVVITGGEPTIYGDQLISLLETIKAMGFLIKLDTNGSNPALLSSLIDAHLVDYIAMDIKGTFEQYPLLTNVKIDQAKIQKSIYLIEEKLDQYEFRMTINKTVHTKQSIETAISYVKRKERFFLQPYHYSDQQIEDKKFLEFTKEELEDFQKLYHYQVKI